jgi:xanthosine utilization system XapX-like protein
VVALVGYGVLTPETLEDAGARMKAGINNSAAWVKEKTEPDVLDELKSRLD